MDFLSRLTALANDPESAELVKKLEDLMKDFKKHFADFGLEKIEENLQKKITKQLAANGIHPVSIFQGDGWKSVYHTSPKKRTLDLPTISRVLANDVETLPKKYLNKKEWNQQAFKHNYMEWIKKYTSELKKLKQKFHWLDVEDLVKPLLAVKWDQVRIHSFHTEIEAKIAFLQALKSKAKGALQLALVGLLSGCVTGPKGSINTTILTKDQFTDQLTELAEKQAGEDIEVKTQVLRKDKDGRPQVIKYIFKNNDGEYATIEYTRRKGSRYTYHPAQRTIWRGIVDRTLQQHAPDRSRFEAFVIDFKETLNNLANIEAEEGPEPGENLNTKLPGDKD